MVSPNSASSLTLSRTFLDKFVRQDIDSKDGLIAGSLTEVITWDPVSGQILNTSFFRCNIFEGLEHTHHTMGHNVPKFAVYLMRSVSGFADRTAPMPNSKSSADVYSSCNCNGLLTTVLERSISKVERYLRWHLKIVRAEPTWTGTSSAGR